jgi:5-methylcytosine-specific restriction endonuclease McrA
MSDAPPPGWSSSDRAARLPARWRIIRARILRRDDYICRIGGPTCTLIATEVDHITRGDDHRPANLQAVCAACHAVKTRSESNAARGVIARARLRESEQHPAWVGVPPSMPRSPHRPA